MKRAADSSTEAQPRTKRARRDSSPPSAKRIKRLGIAPSRPLKPKPAEKVNLRGAKSSRGLGTGGFATTKDGEDEVIWVTRKSSFAFFLRLGVSTFIDKGCVCPVSMLGKGALMSVRGDEAAAACHGRRYTSRSLAWTSDTRRYTIWHQRSFTRRDDRQRKRDGRSRAVRRRRGASRPLHSRQKRSQADAPQDLMYRQRIKSTVFVTLEKRES